MMMTDTQFGALMVLVGGIITAFFTFLGMRVKERISARGSVEVAEIHSRDKFVTNLIERLNRVEVSAEECERRCAEQFSTIAQQRTEINTLTRERQVDKSEIDTMKSQIDVLRRTNRRLESRISEMERRYDIH